jgi:hypothetical protein
MCRQCPLTHQLDHQYQILNVTIDGLEGAQYWVAIIFDKASLTFSLADLGLYSQAFFASPLL